MSTSVEEEVRLISDEEVVEYIRYYSELIQLAEIVYDIGVTILQEKEEETEVCDTEELNCQCASIREDIGTLQKQISDAKDTLAILKTERLRRNL